MSWSASGKPASKQDAEAMIDAIAITDSNPVHHEQLRMAKQAAKVLLAGIPGPNIYVSLSGHGNGVGWQAKEGWSNDCISVSISQSTSPLPTPTV